MKKIFILVCSCTLLAACGNSSKTNKGTDTDSTTIEVVDMHNAETSLDYEGTHKGVFTPYILIEIVRSTIKVHIL